MTHGGNVWQGENPAKWLDASANIRPGGPPAWVKSALTAALEQAMYYPDPQMTQASAALAQFLSLPVSHVLPTAGGLSAIDMAVRLGEAGMLVFTPCFAEYALRGAMHGIRVHSISLLQERRRLALPSTLLRDALWEGCTVCLCNPLNPVGVAYDLSEIQRLLALVEAHNGFLIVDEAFIEYCPQHSAASLIPAHERLILTGSLTKILGIPGVRLGYLCAQPQVMERICPHQLPWEVSCFAQAVLCALPAHREDIRRDAQRNAVCRRQLQAELEALGIYVYPSEAAFVLADFGRNVAPLVQHLKAKGILVRECMSFEGIDDGCHLRLAVKDESSNQRLIAALKEGLESCAENP